MDMTNTNEPRNSDEPETSEDSFTLSEDNIEILEEVLKSGDLHKIFIACPYLEKHINVDNPGTITFLESFLSYFNDIVKRQRVLFSEDEPRKVHRFSRSENAMLVLLVPPHLIICVNGQLLIKGNEVILESILGVYLFKDSEQFFNSSKFSASKVKQWLA